MLRFVFNVLQTAVRHTLFNLHFAAWLRNSLENHPEKWELVGHNSVRHRTHGFVLEMQCKHNSPLLTCKPFQALQLSGMMAETVWVAASLNTVAPGDGVREWLEEHCRDAYFWHATRVVYFMRTGSVSDEIPRQMCVAGNLTICKMGVG